MRKAGFTVDSSLRYFLSPTFCDLMTMEGQKDHGDPSSIIISHFPISLLLSCVFQSPLFHHFLHLDFLLFFFLGCQPSYLFIYKKKNFKKDFICLFLDKGKGRRVTSMCDCLSRPNWGPIPRPTHVPGQGMEQATFWFTGRHSIH